MRVTCKACGDEYLININALDYRRWTRSVNRVDISQAFRQLNYKEKLLLIEGECGCWGGDRAA